jgi:hypothetical protein
VHQLETDDMPARLGLDVSPPSGPSADLYVTEYYRRVFQERTALNATKPHDQQAQERLPIVLVVREMTTGRESNLIIFDAAGEQMRSGTDVARFNRFLYMAKILVFFVTPSSLPRVDSRVNDPGRTQQSPVGTRAMFDQVERQMRQARGVQQGQLDVFASVVLAKADLYQGLEGFDDSLLEEPLYDNLSDTLWRLKDESDQVAQIMTGYGAGNLVGTLDNRFPNCTFHAVSATGASPDEHGRFERIAPVKCIDPLIVPLYRLGLLTEQQQPAGDGW